MKTRVTLKYFVTYCPWKLCFDYNLPKTSSNLTFLTFFVTLGPSTLSKSNVRTIKWQKSPRRALLVTAFPISSLTLKFSIKRTLSLF